MKLIWKIVISIAVLAFIAIIIFVAIKYDPNRMVAKTANTSEIIVEQENISQETYIDYIREPEQEVQFVEDVKKIIEELNSAISSSNYYGDDLEGLVSTERSFLRKLESLNIRLYNLSYPLACASYRNDLCSTFDDICLYEKRLINSIEDQDDFGYENNIEKFNNSFENFIDIFNSMVSYIQNKYG